MHSFDFLLDTYDGERVKTLSVWSSFHDEDLEFRPAPRIRTPHEHMVHQCFSEDTWMKNMFGVDAGRPALPEKETRMEFVRHYASLSQQRLAMLREKPEAWWNEVARFFDVDHTRSWIMLRRLNHSAHHRAQLLVYLRLLGRSVYSVYGPTADTGGLPANKAPTIYRYRNLDDLLAETPPPALPGPTGNATERPAPLGMRALERTPVRVREVASTVSAWQMTIETPQGRGSITLLDSGAYRGDGIFSGWSQEQLSAEYRRWNTPPDEPKFDLQQLG
ncbi:MAG TPA: DinB family protein [Thermoanaerobaculia bacterium]|nr:DinB family protein [Thermoanaerobaculia bacterium]